MQDAAAGRHPLHVAGAQHAVCTGVIAVLERAFEHEGHRLHATMRMLLEAAGRMEPVFAEKQERRGAPHPSAPVTRLFFLTWAGAAGRPTRATAPTGFLRIRALFRPAF